MEGECDILSIMIDSTFTFVIYESYVFCCSGFSTIYLVEQYGSKKKFAVKKMVCHALEDQKIALQEIEYHSMLTHPNILPCLDHTLTDKGVDPVLHNVTVVYMLLPYYSVS